MATVLLAGASGALGRALAAELRSRGYRVRALTRDASRVSAGPDGVDEVFVADALDRQTLAGAFDGIDAVISTLGASARSMFRGRASYRDVDVPANLNLIDGALAAGVKSFVYVSAFGAERSRHLEYCDAHECVVDRLRASGLQWGVVRPTGFFSSIEMFLQPASLGAVPVFGNGLARSNPIHEADIASECADALVDGVQERDVGGPDVLTRCQIADLARRAVGRAPRTLFIPVFLVRWISWCFRLIHPRASHLLAFLATALTEDLVAPTVGRRTLDAYLQQRAVAQRLLKA